MKSTTFWLWTLLNVWCPICLLIWVAKLGTSHVLQSNKNKTYRGRWDRLSVSIMTGPEYFSWNLRTPLTLCVLHSSKIEEKNCYFIDHVWQYASDKVIRTKSCCWEHCSYNIEITWTLLVIKWSASLLCTLMIQVWILLKSTIYIFKII